LQKFFEKFKQKFTTDKSFKFRTIAIGTAVFFGICSILLVFSLFSAIFGVGIFPAAPGRLFSRSFGILSLLIPVYLGYAAFILADPKWKPQRIFILSAIIFPFLTLAVGFAFIRDFDVRSSQFVLLDLAGKTGFSMFIIFLTVIEVLFLQILKNRFFSKAAVTNRSAGFLPPPETAEPDSVGTFTEFTAVSTGEQSTPHDPVELPSISIVSESDFAEPEQTLSDNESSEDEDEEEEEEDDDSTENELELIDEPDENEEQNDTSDSITRAFEEAEAASIKHGEQIRNRKDSSKRNKNYNIPVDILNEYSDGEYWIIDQATRDAAIALKETLEEFKIQAEVTGIRKGPVITMFEILPAPGVKLSKIVGLADNIALRLAASSVRIVAPIPGRHAVGIEVPNAKRNIVSFREIIEGELIRSDNKMAIPIILGKDITGEAQTVDLAQMPHMLIAGATNSGKSVCVNSIILSILYQLHPAECKLMLIDPKIVELKLYNDIPHLLTPVITEPKKALQALQYCIYEMERRYACLDSIRVRDIRSYNKRIKERNIAQEHLPYIVLVIDEFADLMLSIGKELEATVIKLAQKSRAVGIHIVLATQRPSIDVITGTIKANIPSRIAFMVASKIDSRIIIDMIGADKLLGKGDMLYSGVVDPFPIRIQGAFVSEDEVEAVVEHVKCFGPPEYIDDEIFFEEEEDGNLSLFSEGSDPLYDKALEIVMMQGKASASYIQRRLQIGFNRAARLIDEMENNGIVGPSQGSKPREVLRGVN